MSHCHHLTRCIGGSRAITYLLPRQGLTRADAKPPRMLVVKYGGNAMSDGPDAFVEECAVLHKRGVPLVLVHGGGPQIDAGMRELGLPERRVAGLRVTDAAALRVTERVLCGTVNKALVRAFAALGVPAVGLSGQDGGMIVARRMRLEDSPEEDLGFVGEVEHVDSTVLAALLGAGYLPVVAPLGISADGATAYNLNADTAAGAIAGALSADPYVVVTDVPKVRRDPRDPSTGLDRLTAAEARALMSEGAFDGGMLPKMQAVLRALDDGAARAVIAGGTGALRKGIEGAGTTIVP